MRKGTVLTRMAVFRKGIEKKGMDMARRRWQGYEAQRKEKTRYGKDRNCSAKQCVALTRKRDEW